MSLDEMLLEELIRIIMKLKWLNIVVISVLLIFTAMVHYGLNISNQLFNLFVNNFIQKHPVSHLMKIDKLVND